MKVKVTASELTVLAGFLQYVTRELEEIKHFTKDQSVMIETAADLDTVKLLQLRMLKKLMDLNCEGNPKKKKPLKLSRMEAYLIIKHKRTNTQDPYAETVLNEIAQEAWKELLN